MVTEQLEGFLSKHIHEPRVCQGRAMQPPARARPARQLGGSLGLLFSELSDQTRRVSIHFLHFVFCLHHL